MAEWLELAAFTRKVPVSIPGPGFQSPAQPLVCGVDPWLRTYRCLSFGEAVSVKVADLGTRGIMMMNNTRAK